MSLADGIKLSLVAAACTLVLVIVPENVIHIQLDFASKYSPVWIFISYLFLKDEAKSNILPWYFLMIYTTAGILILEAVNSFNSAV